MWTPGISERVISYLALYVGSVQAVTVTAMTPTVQVRNIYGKYLRNKDVSFEAVLYFIFHC